jgi:hypothetical protein
MVRRNGILLLMLLLVAGPSFAQGPAAARKLIEHSMVVTGHVLIEPDGTVSGWELDQADKLPPAVTGLIERSVPIWRFEPVVVDGQARKAKGRMSASPRTGWKTATTGSRSRAATSARMRWRPTSGWPRKAPMPSRC